MIAFPDWILGKRSLTPTGASDELVVGVKDGKTVQFKLDTFKGWAEAGLDAHLADTANPHEVTAAQVGLGNVDNTSDANKPISDAVAAALVGYAQLAGAAFTGPVTVPSQTQGDGSTKAANTSYVDGAIAAVVAAVLADIAAKLDITLPFTETGNVSTSVIYKTGVQYQSQGADVSALTTVPFVHDYRPMAPFATDGGNFFAGQLAGNFTMAPDAGAIGAYAIHSAYNCAVGTQAGNAITTGYNNALFGTNAGRYLTQAFGCAIVGRDAAELLTTGFHTVAIGQSAGHDNETQPYNISIGALSEYSNTAGKGRIAIGFSASFGATGGDYSTVIGHSTGLGVVTGGKNTIIGANVSGLSAALSNTIILADGDGVIRIQVDSAGKTRLPDALVYLGSQTSTQPAWKKSSSGGWQARKADDSGDCAIRSLTTAKAWATVTAATGAVLASQNISAVTRNAAGDFTLTLAAGVMADANYVLVGSCRTSSPTVGWTIVEDASSGKTATTSRFKIIKEGVGLSDPTSFSIVVFGN